MPIATNNPRIPSAYDIAPDDWSELCADWGLPAFRAEQILQGLYLRYAAEFDEILNLPKDLRAKLADTFLNIEQTARVAEIEGAPGETRKLLLELRDSQAIETVLIPMRRRDERRDAEASVTVCVSAQAGCAFGCAFCASGMKGLERNLAAGEIVAQVAQAARVIGQRPANLVFMGIGEPFDNYDAVMAAIRTLNDPRAMDIGARRITISTCGVLPGIRRLAREGLQVELSVSLHAPADDRRSALMPVNRRWPLEELLEACREYTALTGRIITFEYTLIRGFNDHPADADTLLDLLRGINCRVNLIPLSPVAEFEGETPPASTLYGFRDALLDGGVNATLRRSRGAASNAACGQLRLRNPKR